MKYYVRNNFAASELHEAGMVNLGVKSPAAGGDEVQQESRDAAVGVTTGWQFIARITFRWHSVQAARC